MKCWGKEVSHRGHNTEGKNTNKRILLLVTVSQRIYRSFLQNTCVGQKCTSDFRVFWIWEYSHRLLRFWSFGLGMPNPSKARAGQGRVTDDPPSATADNHPACRP